MAIRHAAALCAVCATLCSCASIEQPRQKIVATATLLTADGTIAGNATLSTEGDRLALHVDARGLPPGPHGAHLHAVGRCQPRDFSSAGPHLNPFAMQHGSMNPKGSHLGDLPNLAIAADGNGTLDIMLVGALQEIEPTIFDADGTALVIHAGPDDYRTDPSGASGSRIACGVFAQVR